jgi:hypothetical protein
MHKRILTVLTLLFLLSACDKANDKDLKITLDELKKTLGNLSTQTNEIANEELEKLYKYEYLVSELPLTSSPAEFSEHLNKLGTDRWDCYQIIKETDTYRLFCRRMPKSLLRYLQFLPKFVGS